MENIAGEAGRSFGFRVPRPSHGDFVQFRRWGLITNVLGLAAVPASCQGLLASHDSGCSFCPGSLRSADAPRDSAQTKSESGSEA